MRPILLLTAPVFALLFLINSSAWGQLQVTTDNNALALAQKLVGEGVIISGARITNNPIATGFFINRGNTNIIMDSGIVLTNGRAKSDFRVANQTGVDGDGSFTAASRRADANLGLPGDADLAAELGLPVSQLHDAIALEFDFIPLGDSIKFNYVISSEEYTPGTVCTFYDAFAFFISGPGIPGNKNIALVPGTTTPVTIMNVNNVPGSVCVNNPQYYVDNRMNMFLTHEGHTTLFTAREQVQPCQTYHLKLVIADKGDHAWDTGVFLEAGSLRSDPLKLQAATPINELNLPYLAEGCATGNIHITRDRKKPYPQIVTLTFGGTATAGVDVAPIPSSATIPANDSVVIVPVTALADMVAEGYETFKIYIGNNCSGLFADSIEIQLRDIDMLPIIPADSTRICRNSSVQLIADPGYINYTWTNAGTLSSGAVNDPFATPASGTTMYICTATSGNCIARDSVEVKWKTISLLNKTDLLCNNGTTGTISVGGTGWTTALNYAVNNGAFQPGNTFTGLTQGTYWVKLQDDSGCTDSIQVDLVQTYPDLAISANPVAATCSITPDGRIEVTAAGGNGSYTYSTNGTTYQASSTLIVAEGSYTVYVKDGNNCQETLTPVAVTKNNTVTVDAEPNRNICEGTSYTITAVSNAPNITWAPTTALTNANTLTPTTSTTVPTKYYITAVDGTCSRLDSIEINVWNAPIADAGTVEPICLGITAQLNGSGGTKFEWNTDPSFVTATNIYNPVVKPAQTTTYYLNVEDVNGCKSLQPGQVTLDVTPAVKIFAGKDTVVSIGQPLQLNAIETNSSGVSDWEWTPADYLNNPFTASPVAVFTSPAPAAPYEYTYKVTGTTPIGCQGSDEIKIKVYKGPEIYVPTGFTPNGDGKNDQLIAFPVGIKEFKFLRVFNRWGQIIFTTQNPSRGWDGKIAGSEQQTGVYIWIAEGVDYLGNVVTRRGSTTLIR